ncbi:TPA: restriction endonuclease subunit S [Yersinia enterocolitica]|nr:restriction endonuclease subunit S [Yersinia enterocolitica]
MSIEKNVPEIRFKGFSGEWNEERIQELIDRQAIIGHLDGNHGELYPRANEFSNAGIPYISANDFVTGFMSFSGCKYLPTQRALQFKKGIAKDGDILFAHNATVGPVAKLTTSHDFVILSTTATYFRCDNKTLINDYLLQALSNKKFVEQYSRVMAQSTRNQVPITVQRKFSISIPENTSEQTQIGNYFQKLDALINQHQQKHDKLSNIKKAILEKMFPKQGETMPEIRFKGFSGEWQQREFSDIATRVSTHHQSTCLPCVEYEDIVAGKGRFNKDIHQKKTFKAGLKFEADDVLFGKLRPYLKNWFLADFEGLAIGDFWVLRANNVASTFLFSLIQTNKFELISNLSAGSKMPRSDWGLVSSSCFFIPKNISESNEIGNYFQKLDALINQHQQQIVKLNNIKQACLSKMFI